MAQLSKINFCEVLNLFLAAVTHTHEDPREYFIYKHWQVDALSQRYANSIEGLHDHVIRIATVTMPPCWMACQCKYCCYGFLRWESFAALWAAGNAQKEIKMFLSSRSLRLLVTRVNKHSKYRKSEEKNGWRTFEEMQSRQERSKWHPFAHFTSIKVIIKKVNPCFIHLYLKDLLVTNWTVVVVF